MAKVQRQYLQQIGTMKFKGMEFRTFGHGGGAWIPAMDLGRGLEYHEPKKVLDLIAANPEDFEGFVLGGNGPTSTAEFLPHQGSYSAPGPKRPQGVFLNYQGVLMVLMLKRGKKATAFRRWAVNRLVPFMLRRARRESILDGMSGEERMKYLRERHVMKKAEQRKKAVTGPYHQMIQTLVHVPCWRTLSPTGPSSPGWPPLLGHLATT